MDPSLQPLLEKAFHRAPAREANAAITRARELAEHEEPFSYELIVDAAQSLAELAQKVVPKLVYHLESRGAHPPRFEGVFLSLFVGDELYFVHTRDAMPLFAKVLELDFDQMVQRFGTGELRRAIRLGEEHQPQRDEAPLLLPGKPR